MARTEKFINRGSFVQKHARKALASVAIGAGGLGVAGILNTVTTMDTLRTEQRALQATYPVDRVREEELARKVSGEILVYAGAIATAFTGLGAAYALKKYQSGE